MAKKSTKNIKKTPENKAKKTKLTLKKSSSSTNKSKKSKFVKIVRKRDGSIVPFDLEKITSAIYKALINTNEGDMEDAVMVANHVHSELAKISKTFKGFVPTVEGVQDIVEQQLIVNQYPNTSKHYILYREERAKIRAQKAIVIPEKVKKLAEDSKKYFKNPLAEFVYYRTYSKWIDAENRRETWIETVGRYIDFMKKNLGKKLKDSEYEEIREAILKQEIMPSMRLMQFAGEAAEKTNVCAYNCSFIAPSKIKDFSEIMYVCMCGTGVGFAAESENVQKFPQIQKQIGKKRPTHVVGDSTEGWCDSLLAGLEAWFDGEDIDFDYSQVRPEGERLKTKGGKASGPAPLKELHEFCKSKIIAKQGRRLSNIDVHDIACMIGRIVVVGGVRRSAMISLSELNDYDMREAKDGQFWINHPQRSMANNSAVYEEKPSTTDFLDEWVSLMKSGTGERGIFNRGSLKTQLPERRIEKIGEDTQWGTNPCGEIILQSKQFCNLSEVVCRSNDTEATLLRKIRLATILGTYQASLTKFGYLSKTWKNNCEDEALLGVSLTGQWDSKVVRDDKVLQKLRKETIKINKQYSKKLGINESTCITTTKPSGTVSQVVDSSSGMHPRHAEYYIRRVRIGRTDSLFQMLKDQNIPYYPEVGYNYDNAPTFVLEFPVKAPNGAIVKDKVSALDQLDHWKLVKTNYTEHNPSVTVSVGDDEWIEVGNWIYKNWENVGGLSFLPRSDHAYQLAPYEEIDKDRYEEMIKKVSHIDFSKILAYESTNNIDLKQELACSGGVCETDDLLAQEAADKASK